MTQDTEALKALVALAKKATPGPWTKVGSAKRTLFTTAQGQQTIAPDKAFLPVEIVTCLRHAEQAHADCDFIAAARNAIPHLKALLGEQREERGAEHAELPSDKLRGLVRELRNPIPSIYPKEYMDIVSKVGINIADRIEALLSQEPGDEPDVEGAVAAILRSYLSNYEGDPEVTAGIAAIIRRHMVK